MSSLINPGWGQSCHGTVRTGHSDWFLWWDKKDIHLSHAHSFVCIILSCPLCAERRPGPKAIKTVPVRVFPCPLLRHLKNGLVWARVKCQFRPWTPTKAWLLFRIDVKVLSSLFLSRESQVDDNVLVPVVWRKDCVAGKILPCQCWAESWGMLNGSVFQSKWYRKPPPCHFWL